MEENVDLSVQVPEWIVLMLVVKAETLGVSVGDLASFIFSKEVVHTSAESATSDVL